MRYLFRTCGLLLFSAVIAACSPGGALDTEEPAAPEQATSMNSGGREDFGATVTEIPKPEPKWDPYEDIAAVDWTPMELGSGLARVSCDRDYESKGDGEPLRSLGFSSLWKQMQACRDAGVVRIRYRGKISSDFTALVQRVADMGDTLGIGSRILDIDSSGGQVEDAIRAGDAMAESGWMIWVREDAVCHSSCVLILAAGDMRMIAGSVGIHRMLRIGSRATSRAELNQELREIHEQLSQYLQRNGAATTIADLMMTVPNRSLRLLTTQELDLFGLSGRNAAEDDLDRIRLARKCGEAFVRRQDAFFRDYNLLCANPGEEVAGMGECGRDLKRRYGFPDRDCPADGPLSEYD
ncbi:hypothetical protein [Marilutibacter chinensis]|uniref:Uncharacterized protein n=1 Tax=Marilutibacter chinensis TaxID=2912247 RepID=A0ABS9HSA1_9GAMM|nr:hypothetical protein [Lysobacter chinensis]MCF7221217.1 hypothetical protein [Lysobacter chinensis]MCF7223042.1 hypothetical protein [Lysobacter chinensis]